MRASSSVAASILALAQIGAGLRSLSLDQRLDFLDAVQCLQSKPAKTETLFAGAKSRYDDFQALHIIQTEDVHFCGSFFAWHRNFLALLENDLHTTCGYPGGIPYWNWTMDAADMLASPLFDPVYGFGGNGIWIENTTTFPSDWQILADIPGRTGGGCITDGPFANRTVPLGPGNHTDYRPHCLHRDFSPYLLTFTGNKTKLDWVLEAEDFWNLDHRTEGIALGVPNMSLHAAGHQSLGGNIGEITNMYSSPGDPLFYLHHSMLDNVWNTWQHLDWETRKTDIGGPDTMWAYPYNYNGDIPYKNITLDTLIAFPHVAETIPIRDVMDIQGGHLCYTYD
ncbi:uncharacterized protein BCR38DRAFT_528749 [Pseudomassariella vexata]|uniref:Tyrosinase copper-binding domain-containing protein n=1 Tax=Pseudomassariella vexata TaxID=1141098 RepID=A0A1Y2D9W0_9PEZI|nr:uncharacterized protein BCR38DRAFT_528749 [Pseudomassariella vexata]ORY55906.1 hypothetical protein BCR38DRAFT_528749 [Pseudomassariella vexata]